MSLKKYKKYRLVLDEGLPLPVSYPNLNNLHNVVHIIETKHFKPLITSDSVSVIALSTNLTDKQADLKICKVLREAE